MNILQTVSSLDFKFTIQQKLCEKAFCQYQICK